MIEQQLNPYEEALKDWRALALELTRRRNKAKANANVVLTALNIAIAEGRIDFDIANQVRFALESV